MSDLERTIDAFRAALARRESAAAAELARAYGAAYGRISARLAELLEALEAGTLTPAQLVRDRRYRALLRQIEDELAAYGATATGVVTRAQADAVTLAIGHAEALTRAALGPAPASVAIRWNALPAEAFADLVGALQDGSPLRSLFDALGRQASERAREALTSGLAAGRGPRVVARELRRASGMSLTRALTISRTELLRAYRSSTLRLYRANTQVVRGWTWHARLDRRTCGVCIAMHGKHFTLEQPFGTHTNCRCAMLPRTFTWAELGFSAVPERPEIETGEDWFARQSEATQLQHLGPGKTALYRSGRIGLMDIVGERIDPRWGLARYEKSLSDIAGGL